MTVNAPVLLVICFLLAGLTACATSDGGSLKIRSLAKGTVSGIRVARREIIKDETAWETLWKEHSCLNRNTTRLPAVDFSREMVVAVTTGTKRTGGYSVEIVGLDIAEKKLEVRIKESSPPPGTMSIQMLTAPFHFAAVPRSDLPVYFVEIGQTPKPAGRESR